MSSIGAQLVKVDPSLKISWQASRNCSDPGTKTDWCSVGDYFGKEGWWHQLPRHISSCLSAPAN
jgi:hypothetical protein